LLGKPLAKNATQVNFEKTLQIFPRTYSAQHVPKVGFKTRAVQPAALNVPQDILDRMQDLKFARDAKWAGSRI
jgi:hypothetical protein